MPALFDVPGWSVPSAPVSTQGQSRKRKRAALSEEQDRLCAAQASLDKLVDSLGSGVALGDDAGGGSLKKKRKAKLDKPQPSHRDQSQRSPHLLGEPHSQTTASAPAVDLPAVSAPPAKKEGRKSAKRARRSTDTPEHSAVARGTASLTSLQQHFRKSLDGARFRLLNETLYKSTSAEAAKMMKDDPSVFGDYHIGFRRQVQSWPSNPVSHFVSELSSYPTRTVIADLGCGDAALARALLPKNFVVLSFDLVSDGAYVVEADICSHVPLPGSEPQSAELKQGDGQVVDVVVCALSLMSTNWPKCIREAWRILRPGGELMIAEVASRFASVDKFTSLVGSVGFELQKEDDRNSHFTLFRFKKVARAVVSGQEWSTLMSSGYVLKSCEYKRR